MPSCPTSCLLSATLCMASYSQTLRRSPQLHYTQNVMCEHTDDRCIVHAASVYAPIYEPPVIFLDSVCHAISRTMSAKCLCPDVRFLSDTTLLNVNAHRYVGKVVPERIYVGSLFRHSNVNTALVNVLLNRVVSSMQYVCLLVKQDANK